MNKKMIVFTIGKLLTITGLLMFMPVIVSLIYQETEGVYYAILGIIMLALGILISRKAPRKKNIYAREGFCYRSIELVIDIIIRGHSVLFNW